VNLDEARPTWSDFGSALSYIHGAEGPFDRLYVIDVGTEDRDGDPIVFFGDPDRTTSGVVYEIYGKEATEKRRTDKNVKVAVEAVDSPRTEALYLDTVGDVRLYDVPSSVRREFRAREDAYAGHYDPTESRLGDLLERLQSRGD